MMAALLQFKWICKLYGFIIASHWLKPNVTQDGDRLQLIIDPWTTVLTHPPLCKLPGHLMAKKSIESLPGLHDSNRDYLPPLERGGNDVLDRYELMPAVFRALSHLRSHSRTLHTADRLHVLRSRGVEEDRDKYLREVCNLIKVYLRVVPPLFTLSVPLVSVNDILFC